VNCRPALWLGHGGLGDGISAIELWTGFLGMVVFGSNSTTICMCEGFVVRGFAPVLNWHVHGNVAAASRNTLSALPSGRGRCSVVVVVGVV